MVYNVVSISECELVGFILLLFFFGVNCMALSNDLT